MSLQPKINKLVKALKAMGWNICINQYQVYSETRDKVFTKYVVHTGNPKKGIECWGKQNLLRTLLDIYNGDVHRGEDEDNG